MNQLTTWRAMRARQADLRADLERLAPLVARGTAHTKERARLLLHAHDALTVDLRGLAEEIIETRLLAESIAGRSGEPLQRLHAEAGAALVELYGPEKAAATLPLVLADVELLVELLGDERLTETHAQIAAAKAVAAGLDKANKEVQHHYHNGIYDRVRARLVGRAWPEKSETGSHWLRALRAYVAGTGTRTELREALDGTASAASRQREKRWRRALRR